MNWREIGVEEAEGMWRFDDAHAGGPLLVNNLVAEGLHLRPVHLRPEVVFGVVSVVEPDPVVKLVVTAHAPRDRLVWIAAVMPVIPVQIGKAVTEIVKRKKKTDIAPVKDTQNDERHDEEGELQNAPAGFARISVHEFLEDSFGIFAEKAEEGVLERMLGFPFLAVFVN